MMITQACRCPAARGETCDQRRHHAPVTGQARPGRDRAEPVWSGARVRYRPPHPGRRIPAERSVPDDPCEGRPSGLLRLLRSRRCRRSTSSRCRKNEGIQRPAARIAECTWDANPASTREKTGCPHRYSSPTALRLHSCHRRRATLAGWMHGAMLLLKVPPDPAIRVVQASTLHEFLYCAGVAVDPSGDQPVAGPPRHDDGGAGRSGRGPRGSRPPLAWYFLGLGLVIVLLGSLWVLIDRFATGRAWWILVAVVDLLVIVGWVMLADRLWPGHPHRRRRRQGV